ncbi:adenylate/guanylate cyclase domain-containing protein [Rhodospirillaceae bacterium SYSU D60014]|uniref:tetratricopeptide repeat protein n=1 Tax=Virgifigura deserti TaxID=2268457 RepID=UPI000E663B1F
MTPHNIRRKLSTILSADVAGFSRLMGADEEGTLRTLNHYRSLIDSLVAEHRGRVFAAAGDNLVAEFAATAAAVRCALRIQEDIETRNAALPPERRMRFRIGINLGDVMIEGENLFGDGVNVAARLEALSEPGGIAISGTVYDQIEGKLPLQFEPLGERLVKNIDRPVRVYRLRVAPAEDGLVPAADSGSNRTSLPIPAKPSIAVLPFINMTGDSQQAYLTDGITEDIITNLSKFRELFVISRNSSFRFEGGEANPQQTGRDLGVRYLLQGSLRRAGSRVRIAVQLVDAATGHHLWAERYDRELTDIFEVQDELTQLIVATLAVRLEEAEKSRVRRAETEDLEAYGFRLRGQMFLRRYSKDGLAEAKQMYRRALERDPDYSRAYAALATAHIVEWRYGWTASPAESLEKALEFAKRSIALSENSARGHAALGFVYLYTKQRAAAIVEYERALALNPNDADIMAEFADALTHDGRALEAVELLHKAMRLNPFFPDWYLWYLGDAYYTLGRYEEAIRTLERMNDPAEGYRLLAASYAQLGRAEEAAAYAAKVLEMHPNFSVADWAEKQPDQDPEALEIFLDGLRKAGLPA